MLHFWFMRANREQITAKLYLTHPCPLYFNELRFFSHVKTLRNRHPPTRARPVQQATKLALGEINPITRSRKMNAYITAIRVLTQDSDFLRIRGPDRAFDRLFAAIDIRFDHHAGPNGQPLRIALCDAFGVGRFSRSGTGNRLFGRHI